MSLGPDTSFIEPIDWQNNLEPGKYNIVGYLKAEIIYKYSGDKIEPYTIKTRPMLIIVK